jgi:hypothetical protein
MRLSDPTFEFATVVMSALLIVMVAHGGGWRG